MDIWNEFCKDVKPLRNKKPIRHQEKTHLRQRSDNYLSQNLDLHGQTLEQAQKDVSEYLDDIHKNGIRDITIITGKSGEMLRELPMWLEGNPHISSCELKKNGGSYKIRLKKK